MIRETICGWIVWMLCYVFGIETFSIAVTCFLPDRVLFILEQYIREIPA